MYTLFVNYTQLVGWNRENFPNNLKITAETDCGEIMAIQHKKLPVYGVQFHPESIMSEHGH